MQTVFVFFVRVKNRPVFIYSKLYKYADMIHLSEQVKLIALET